MRLLLRHRTEYEKITTDSIQKQPGEGAMTAMTGDIFQQYIDSIEATPQWKWEYYEATAEYGSMWLAKARDNGGMSAMVCEMERGYRASLCIEHALTGSDTVDGIVHMEMALAHEGIEFLTAREAMLWVEHQAWNTLARMLGIYRQPVTAPLLRVQRYDSASTQRDVAWKHGGLVIGRDSSSDIVIDHRYASRRHARLEHLEHGFFLSDLNSTNGTYINGKRAVGKHPLFDQDQIIIADTILIFHHPIPA
jgi:hypothetical protein